MSSPLKTNTDRGEALGFVLCVFTCHLRPNVKNSKLLRWTEEKMCASYSSSHVSLHVCACVCREVSVQMRGNQAEFVYLGKA